MKNAYKVIAFLALVFILAGIAASVVAFSMGASMLGLLDNVNVYINGDKVNVPNVQVDGAKVSVGSDGNGVYIGDGTIHIGPKNGGVNISID